MIFFFLILFFLWSCWFYLLKFIFFRKPKKKVIISHRTIRGMAFIKSYFFRFKKYFTKTEVFFFEKSYKTLFSSIISYFKKGK